MPFPQLRTTVRVLVLAGVLTALVAPALAEKANAAAPGVACARAASSALRSCLKKVSSATRLCYGQTASACDPSSPKIASANAVLESKVLDRCSAPGEIEAAGLGAALTPAGLVDRLQEACMGELASLAARSFGGPHGKALPGAGAENQECMDEAFDRASRMIQLSFRQTSACAQRELSGKSCNVPATEAKVATYQETAAERIDKKCTDLVPLVGLNRDQFLERAATQARCLIPTAHGASTPFDLDCGPRTSVPLPPRATATQVVLDESEWGTRCGDGSPYAFWVRPAPVGSPVENVLVYMQGGGVCLFEEDCAGVSTGLFRSLEDGLVTSGFMSSSNAANPFRDWTKVYLPYCTQDLHFGGGTTSNFPSITVHRFGALNVRAALRWVRDALWAELDSTSPEGFRPDRLKVIFSGGSAGGFGASYNYHYLLDDLRWVHTTAAPDSGLGLNNGSILGVAGLGQIMVSQTAPHGWGVRPFMAPYCKTAQCAVVPNLQKAHSERLGSVPDQQILNVSNQVDNTQVSTTFFSSLADWIDALRVAYCATQGLPGLHYFLPAVPSSIHVIVQNGSLFPSLASAGETIGQWLGGAMASPESVVDRVEESDFETRYGVAPFACPVSP